MITFAIPTWNRAEQLEKTVRSIAAEIQAEKVGEIIVCDHGSTDGTWAMLERLKDEYPFLSIQHLARTETSDFQDNFQHTFSQAKTDWTWTFGDDDLLLPGSLKTVLELIKSVPVEFIHCAEVVRASEKESVTKGTLLKLCQDYGWIEMTGFITCNIVKTARLKCAVNRLSWEGFSKNAFPQSCALLEELAEDQALFLDKALIDTQFHELTPETNKRWEQFKIAERYFFVDEPIRDLMDRGFIPDKLDNVFFRYHAYFIWDRLIGNIISDYSNFPDKPHDHLWAHVEKFPDFLEDPGSSILRRRVKEVRDTIKQHYDQLMSMADVAGKLNMMVQAHNHNWFPFCYTGPAIGVAMPNPPEDAIAANGIARIIYQAQQRQRERDLKALDEGAANKLRAMPLADFKA